MWMGELGEIGISERRIDLLLDTKSFETPPNLADPKTRELEQFEVVKQLKARIIEPAISELAAPFLLTPRKTGKWCFCIDYRQSNTVTLKDTHPLPIMDDGIDLLDDSEVSTTIDAYAGTLADEHTRGRPSKVSFCCHAGSYQYKGTPFGLTNAPARFQRALDTIASQFRWNTSLVYIDNVIIYSNTIEDQTHPSCGQGTQRVERRRTHI